MSITDQLKYKFVISLEGNDVATNLKWIMLSNSVCFMRKPRVESWFMEGSLIPNHHYVLLDDEFSDLEDKIDYYSKHTDKALAIIKMPISTPCSFLTPAGKNSSHCWFSENISIFPVNEVSDIA